MKGLSYRMHKVIWFVTDQDLEMYKDDFLVEK